jgi:hypothetical protein
MGVDLPTQTRIAGLPRSVAFGDVALHVIALVDLVHAMPDDVGARGEPTLSELAPAELRRQLASRSR